jgi:hypothetical protein
MALRRSWVRIPLGPLNSLFIQARTGAVGHPTASRGGCKPGDAHSECRSREAGRLEAELACCPFFGQALLVNMPASQPAAGFAR